MRQQYGQRYLNRSGDSQYMRATQLAGGINMPSLSYRNTSKKFRGSTNATLKLAIMAIAVLVLSAWSMLVPASRSHAASLPLKSNAAVSVGNGTGSAASPGAGVTANSPGGSKG